VYSTKQQSKGGKSHGSSTLAAAPLTFALQIDQICHSLTAAQQLADDSLVQGCPQLSQQQLPHTLHRGIMLLPVAVHCISLHHWLLLEWRIKQHRVMMANFRAAITVRRSA
jgi:hypothetical protein